MRTICADPGRRLPKRGYGDHVAVPDEWEPYSTPARRNRKGIPLANTARMVPAGLPESGKLIGLCDKEPGSSNTLRPSPAFPSA